MRKRITMDTWIAEVVNDTSNGPISAIMLTHREGTREQEVWASKFSEHEKIEPSQLAVVFQRKAEMHVQDIAGFQQFYLKAYYSGRQEYQARLPFQIENGQDMTYGSTEPPTDEGVRQQKMRQGEAAFQIWVTGATNLANIQNTLIRQMAEDRAKLMTENMDAVSVVKEMILQQAKSNHEFLMQQMQFQRESKLIEAGLKIGPSLLNAATGREIIPQNMADSSLVETILDSLDENGIKKLGDLNLPPEVMGAIAARATEHFKKKAEAEKLAAESARTDPILSVYEGGKKDAS